jgi:hypothetical protein
MHPCSVFHRILIINVRVNIQRHDRHWVSWAKCTGKGTVPCRAMYVFQPLLRTEVSIFLGQYFFDFPSASWVTNQPILVVLDHTMRPI